MEIPLSRKKYKADKNPTCRVSYDLTPLLSVWKVYPPPTQMRRNKQRADYLDFCGPCVTVRRCDASLHHKDSLCKRQHLQFHLIWKELRKFDETQRRKFGQKVFLWCRSFHYLWLFPWKYGCRKGRIILWNYVSIISSKQHDDRTSEAVSDRK